MSKYKNINIGIGTRRPAAANPNNNRAPRRSSARKKAGIKPSDLARLQASLRHEAEHWVDVFVRDTHCSYLYATALVESLALTIPYARLSQPEREKEMMGAFRMGVEMYVSLLGSVIAKAEFEPALHHLGGAAVGWLQDLTNDAIDDLLAVGYPILFSELTKEGVWELVSQRFGEAQPKTDRST